MKVFGKQRVLKNEVTNAGPVFDKRLCKGGQTSYFIHIHRLPELSHVGPSLSNILYVFL